MGSVELQLKFEFHIRNVHEKFIAVLTYPKTIKVCAKYTLKFPLDDDGGGLAILTSMPVSELELLLTEYTRRVASVEKGGVLERYYLLKLDISSIPYQ